MITLEKFKKKQLDKCRLLGLDLGSKRIGVSICDEKQLIATPFKTIKRSTAKEFVDELKNIIKENDIKGIIIGNPLNMDGSSGTSAQSVKDTSNNIQKPINLFGLSKLINYEIIKSYRKMFNVPICTVISFNHLVHLKTAACHKILNFKKIDDYSILSGKTVLLKRI